MPQEGAVSSLVSKLICNLCHQNGSTYAYLIQFILYDKRVIHIHIACPQSSVVMLLFLGYLENEFRSTCQRRFGIVSDVVSF